MAGHLAAVKPFPGKQSRKSVAVVRNALAVGATLGIFGVSGAGHAAPFFFGPFDGGTRFAPPEVGTRVAPSDGGYRLIPRYLPSRRAGTGTKASKNRDTAKAPTSEIPKGTLQIV